MESLSRTRRECCPRTVRLCMDQRGGETLTVALAMCVVAVALLAIAGQFGFAVMGFFHDIARQLPG